MRLPELISVVNEWLRNFSPVKVGWFIAICLPFQSLAQDEQGIPRDLLEQRIEAAAEALGDDSDVDLTTLVDVLTDYYQSPLDLNHAESTEISQLFLLDNLQISALVDHIREFGQLASIYELQTIDAFDRNTIENIRPFVTVRESATRTRATFKEIMQQGSHEVHFRSIMSVEERSGFQDRTSFFGKEYSDPDGDPLPDFDDPTVVDSLRENNRVYLGSPLKVYARYRFKYRNNISFGVTAEKDEGEEFLKGSQPDGFDFYSAHLFLQDVGPFKKLALGDYQAQFGQGLTYSTGLAFASKSSYTMNIKRNPIGLQSYRSVNENLFLRGAGATFELGNFEITGLYSKKKLDGNVILEEDTLDVNGPDQVLFSSFQEDGLHRTTRELQKKDAIDEQHVAGHVRYNRNAWSLGATAANVQYGALLSRNTQAYTQFEFQGKENTTYGLDANILYRNVNVFGEASASANGGAAAMIGLVAALDKRVSVSLLYRNYSRDFHGLYSVAFAESSNPWNEKGLYTGIEITPNRQWRFNAYFDQFSFPWLRYQTGAPSSGFDVLGQLTWKPKRGTEIYIRARHRDKARDTGFDEDAIDPLVRVVQDNYRFNANYKVSDGVSLRTRVEAVNFKRGESPLEHGFLIYQDIVHRPLSSKVELTLRFALINTDSYNSRVYAYENDLVGLFTILPYYGRGIRQYYMVRITPLRRVDVWLRYGSWIYTDRTSYSSGLQEINGNMRSDVKLQVRWKF